MRKGLRLTLMTVAIALISVQAMATAPTIMDIPSPVVGNAEPVTDAGKFVYIDAMDMNNLATDDVTASKDLMWTYVEYMPGTVTSSSLYLINGVAPLPLVEQTIDKITSPTTNNIINRVVRQNEWNPDGKANTITIRNNYLAPISPRTGIDTSQWADGIILTTSKSPDQTRDVFFFCSDGTSYSMSKVAKIYSTNNDYDRMSGSVWKPTTMAGYQPKPFDSRDTTGKGWKPENWSPGVTSSTWAGGTGLCLKVGLTGSNLAEYASPLPYFQLTKNTVYRIKVQMNGSQGAVGHTPLWDLVIENIVPSTGVGLMAYMMDNMFYDDAQWGGANTVINTQNGDWKTFYWTPMAVEAPQWDKVFSTPGYDDKNDPRFRFRVMDVDNVGAGNTKSGSICIQSLTVDQLPIGRVRIVQNLVNINQANTDPTKRIIQANSAGTGNVEAGSIVSPLHVTITFANGAVTVKPTSTPVPATYDSNGDMIPDTTTSGQQFEMTAIDPAMDTSGATSNDNWPLTWDANTIYRVQVGLSAPTPEDAAKPWDAVFLSMHDMTYEMFTDTYMTSRDLLGSPAYIVGSDGKIVPQLYDLFWYSGKGTKAPSPGNRLRWIVRFANSPSVAFPSGNPATDPLNTGAVVMNSVRVDKIGFTF